MSFNSSDIVKVRLVPEGCLTSWTHMLGHVGVVRELNDDRSFVVDCMDYRKAKDAELRQMARFMMERAKSSGAPQEMGPLNPYCRRLVHLTVAEDPQMSSESIGDAFLKTVIIAVRK